MKRISYSKNFLSGTLKGMSVRCGFTVPASSAQLHLQKLNALVLKNPGSDCGTGAKFWVSCLGCEEVAV